MSNIFDFIGFISAYPKVIRRGISLVTLTSSMKIFHKQCFHTYYRSNLLLMK